MKSADYLLFIFMGHFDAILLSALSMSHCNVKNFSKLEVLEQ